MLGFYTLELFIFVCGESSYRDENGEPLMDFDEDVPSDGDEPQQYLLDDEDDGVDDRRERSATPVYNDSKVKPRKRLIKKFSSDNASGPVDLGLEDDEAGGGNDDSRATKTGKESYINSGNSKKERGEKRKNVEKKQKGEKHRRNGGGRMGADETDPEMKEMWDTVAGGDSEVRFFCIAVFDFSNAKLVLYRNLIPRVLYVYAFVMPRMIQVIFS